MAHSSDMTAAPKGDAGADPRLSESREQFIAQQLAEAQALAKLGSWQAELLTDQCTWSAETYRIFEVDPASFRPAMDTIRNLVHPEDRDILDEAFEASIAERKAAAIEHRILLPNGTVKYLDARWKVICDETGRPTRAVGTCQDITEQELSRQRIRESEERFLQLAENLNEVFWITNVAKTEMFYISPAYEEVWGRSRQSLMEDARGWMDSVHPEDRERVVRAATTQQADGSYDETYRIVRPDGSVRWIRDRAFPVRNGAGEVYRVVGAAEDITAQKKLEAQFLRAQRMESIGTLAGGIAHDLNNILAPIMMSIEFLKLKVKDPECTSALESLLTCSQRGADLLKQVLAFGRGLEGRRVRVNLVPLLRDIQKIIRDTFPKSIEFKLLHAPDVWSVLGDPTQLHQVVLNLCVNARDAMPNGGCLILSMENVVLEEEDAKMLVEAKAGSFVMIKVSDSGTGIPVENRDRIFEPFFTTKEIGKGTGLGLSTAAAIVRSHGGFINVESALGLGTAFQIYIPASGLLPGDSGSETTHLVLPRGNGELVLLVDDEEGIRNIARKTLEKFGYEVVTAANGAEAIAVFAQHKDRIRVVLTDMAMPVMDGPKLIGALRSMEPKVKIIGSSGLSTVEGIARATGTEIEHFVPKPYTTEAILLKLRYVLSL